MKRKIIFLLPLVLLVVSCEKKDQPKGHLVNKELSFLTTNEKLADKKAIVGILDWKENSSIENMHVQRVSRAVGLITIPSMPGNRCTAFLINENTVMTNWHCFPNKGQAKGARLYLDFYFGENKDSFKNLNSYLCEDLILSYKPLDVALLRCEENPGKDYGFLELETAERSPSLSENIYVIHQNCDYHKNHECAPTKKFSSGVVIDIQDDIFYDADTLGGSSGSPVFSAQTHKVLALHHMGHGKTFFSKGRGDKNSGVPMYKIVAYMKEYFASNTNSFIDRYATIEESISNIHEIDFYQLKIDFLQNIKIRLNSNYQLGDLDLYLLNEDKKILAKSESTTNIEIIQGRIKSGNYLLAVKGHKGALGKYTLNLQ